MVACRLLIGMSGMSVSIEGNDTPGIPVQPERSERKSCRVSRLASGSCEKCEKREGNRYGNVGAERIAGFANSSRWMP
jgi:hypothetical protein